MVSKRMSLEDIELREELNSEKKTVKPVKRLLTPLLSKKVPHTREESERQTLPLYTKNILSRIFFTWLIPLFARGYKRTLDYNDLWKLDNRLSLQTTYPRFQNNLNKITKSYQIKKKLNDSTFPDYAILYALFLTFKWEYSFAILASTLAYGFIIVAPILIKELIDVVENKVLIPSSPINDGVGYAVGIALCTAFAGLFYNHCLQNSKLVGAHARSIITKSLMEKSFAITSKSKHDFSNSKVFTLMSSDLSKIDMAISYFPFVVAIPLPFIAGVAILIVNIGVASLTGIGIFVISMALLSVPASFLLKYREKSAQYTDKRVGLMREVLNSMKMIKLYAWENAYHEKIIEERSKESYFIFLCEWITNTVYAIVFNLSPLASMTAFLVLYAIDRSKSSAGAVFSSLALYNTLTNLIADFPMLLSFCTAGWVSVKRVAEFLKSPIEPFQFEEQAKIDGNTAIKVTDGKFEWENFEDDDEKSGFTLENVKIEIPKGSFVVVTGSTGAGKSSLLSAIKGNMKRVEGNVSIDGTSILCGSPWIQSTTIRENIVFGSKFDPALYRKTIKACSLEIDINNLPAGDMTSVGERGVTLSGGQKARINLARAIYSQRDIYLFDDVLSAVDAKVGKHIVENCFLGLISDKTRVLATHQLSLISKADQIVFINDDGKIDTGTPEELQYQNAKFQSLMNFSKTTDDEVTKKVVKNHDEVEMDDFDDVDGGLYDKEDKAVNAIPFSIYKQYLKAGSGIFGWAAFPVLIFVTIASIFFSMFANIWLSFWIDKKFGYSDGVYIGIYILFTFLAVISMFLELAVMGYLIINSSKNLNLNAVKRVMRTPMSFVDTTPSGRILNRFTKDTNSLDNEIGNHLKLLIHFFVMIIAILVMCVVYLPWFAIAIPLIVAMFGLVANFYQASSREVKRLEALSRSHLYHNFNEVLNGMSTIKAYGSEYRFIETNDELVDRLNESYLVTVANQRWIGITLDLTGCGIAFVVTMLALTRQFNISAASTGLITTYILDLSGVLSLWLVSYSEVENEMNSVERLCHYANDLEQESDYKIPGRAPAPEWPQNGAINFNNVSLRYRSGLPLVLKNLDIKVEANQKIGICGRTGAGKSSIIYAIYRLTELAEGTIEIDGVDVKNIGLHDLRSKLSIIPQDPVLFEGTVRRNLDPFNEHEDLELWDALRRSGLIDAINLAGVKSDLENKFHLEALVEDEGANFSLGERQLLALGRALVRRSKILIMDEATSSVDYETDALVQRTITKEFKDCTVLCIAHRLKTILNYDKILVLEKGEIEQFDTPIHLFRQSGRFREMCDSSNITEQDFIE